MRLDEGWNQIQFNLSDFTRRAYGEHCCQSRDEKRFASGPNHNIHYDASAVVLSNLEQYVRLAVEGLLSILSTKVAIASHFKPLYWGLLSVAPKKNDCQPAMTLLEFAGKVAVAFSQS